jgi:hypothetical protein
MFGNRPASGKSALFSGIAGMFIRNLITRRIAGRAAGVAARGGGGIPGLLIWVVVSYLINRFVSRRPVPQARR